MINREELAWAAGFYDGEGSTKVRLANPGGHPPMLSVAQVDQRSLIRLQAAVLGVGKIYGPYGPYQKNHKPFYQWQTTNLADSIAACGLLWYWLGPAKREQIAVAFRLHWGK